MHPTIRRATLAVSLLALAVFALGLVASTPTEVHAAAPSFEKLVVSSTAVGISSGTLALPNGRDRRRCFMTLEGGPIRWLVNGDDPTSSTGHLFVVGAALDLPDDFDLRRFRAIRTTSTDGTLSITCRQ